MGQKPHRALTVFYKDYKFVDDFTGKLGAQNLAVKREKDKNGTFKMCIGNRGGISIFRRINGVFPHHFRSPDAQAARAPKCKKSPP